MGGKLSMLSRKQHQKLPKYNYTLKHSRFTHINPEIDHKKIYETPKRYAELGGKRKTHTPKKSKFKVSRVYRSTRKNRNN